MIQTVCVTEKQFRALRPYLPSVTREHLMSVYGISENTWSRMRRGLPIRLTTFQRMMARAPAQARLDLIAADLAHAEALASAA